jgi:hypothetical protein
MTLDEAVKQLSGAGEIGAFTYDQTFKNACKLGKEALLRIKQYRNRADIRKSFLLPGETAE